MITSAKPFPDTDFFLSEGYCIKRCTVGDSMFPILRSGKIIEIGPVSTDSLVCGEIIVFRTGDFTVAHRLVKTSFDNSQYVFYTKADSYWFSPLQKVYPEQLLGRVTAVELWGGRMIKLHQRPMFWISIVVGIGAPLFGSVFRAIMAGHRVWGQA